MKNRLEQYPSAVMVRREHQDLHETDDSRVPESIKKIPQQITAGLGKYPAVTLGTGLVIGALIGWFIKRR